jgi:hypothetical protein
LVGTRRRRQAQPQAHLPRAPWTTSLQLQGPRQLTISVFPIKITSRNSPPSSNG